MSKTALITGITGQDGSYLSEFLLNQGYKVVGMVSQKNDIGGHNIDHIKDQLVLETGDLLDKDSLGHIFDIHHPDEVYNLAGLSFVPPSWEKPNLTLNVNTLGVARILEIIKDSFPQTRFYQASSSKIFGNPKSTPQNEQTLIQPLDPYAISKASAHRLVQVMRQHYQLFACSGILFNHESERRGPEFVTRKITQTAAQIKLGHKDQLVLGDLDAKQDWGYAPDYVEAMWLMLQHDQADDYVIASGENHTVRQVCEIAFSHLELDYLQYVKVDSSFVRKEKITTPQGDSSKAKQILGWQPKTSFKDMIIKMTQSDLQLAQESQ